MRVLCLTLVVVLLGCSGEASSAPAPPPTSVERGAPMEPLRPPPPEEPAEPAPSEEPPPPSQVVIHVERMLGWHRFSDVRTLDGPWAVEGAREEAGDETVEAVGRELTRCRTSELPRGGSVTYCPDVGIVRHTRREGSWQVDESLAAFRRGDTTWAVSACATMRFVGDAARAPLCEHAVRTYGAEPPRPQGCRWRYTLDGPSNGHREVAVEVRLSRDVRALDEWIGADSSVTFVEASRTRGWIERGDGWAAAIRVRRDLCGEATEGSELAARLVDLAPE